MLGHELYGAGSFLFGTADHLALRARCSRRRSRWGSRSSSASSRRADPARPVTALVETLAAIPSVVIGLWGILVLGPALRDHVEPALHSALGFIPLFGEPGTGSSMFTAIIVLTIMILPIVSSISRELFLGVPHELKEGALALGTTRWEMVRGVVFPYARGGIAAALILGLGRALGEAIAVTQVIGDGSASTANLFVGGDTLGEQDRRVVPGRDDEPPDRLARLPRADPARLLAGRERRRRSGSSAASRRKHGITRGGHA